MQSQWPWLFLSRPFSFSSFLLHPPSPLHSLLPSPSLLILSFSSFLSNMIFSVSLSSSVHSARILPMQPCPAPSCSPCNTLCYTGNPKRYFCTTQGVELTRSSHHSLICVTLGTPNHHVSQSLTITPYSTVYSLRMFRPCMGHGVSALLGRVLTEGTL